MVETPIGGREGASVIVTDWARMCRLGSGTGLLSTLMANSIESPGPGAGAGAGGSTRAATGVTGLPCSLRRPAPTLISASTRLHLGVRTYGKNSLCSCDDGNSCRHFSSTNAYWDSTRLPQHRQRLKRSEGTLADLDWTVPLLSHSAHTDSN